MMLPQFGFIVAQAGADSHTLPTLPPPPTVVPPPPPTPSVTNNVGSSNTSGSPAIKAATGALAPLLHSKPIYTLNQPTSSHMSNDGGAYYNTYSNNNTTSGSTTTTSPYYSRQPSPSLNNVIHQPLLPIPPSASTTQQQRVVTPPPPPPMFNNYHSSNHQTHKEIMPKSESRGGGAFTPSSSSYLTETSNTYKKKKQQHDNSPWYRHQTPYYNDHPLEERQPFIDHGNTHSHHNKWHYSMTMNSHNHKATSRAVTPPPPPPPQPLHQTTQSNTNTTGANGGGTSHRQEVIVKEYNDLMTWMDNEFWEQADEIYQEKLANLQNELIHLQKGTHSAFREMIADFEFQREKTISDAECFMKYQISFIQQYFDQDIHALEDEYENERRHLQDTLIHSIEDKKRQIKDDRDESNDNEENTPNNNNTTKVAANTSKRNLRKRNADLTTVAALRSEPLSKRRAVRPSTLHNIHTISPIEDEELEEEFLNMKKATNKLFV